MAAFSAVPIRHTRISAIHLKAMLCEIGALFGDAKPLKILLIIVLVWLAPGLLLFVHLARSNQLFARYRGSLNRRMESHRTVNKGHESHGR